MPTFITAFIVAIVLAIGAAYVLEGYQTPAETAYTSSSTVRL